VFSNLLLLSGLEIQGTMFRHGMHAIARYHLVRCLECLLSLLYFFILFFGLLFFEIFSVCFPSTVIKRQEGASILCLAGRCGAVVSDFFFYFFFLLPCATKRRWGNIGAHSSSEEGAVPSAMLHYTFEVLLRTQEIGNVLLNSPFQGGGSWDGLSPFPSCC
jgi:hypothetical protein